MKSIIKQILPRFVVRGYHWILALLAVGIYQFPSKKMVVIGITGTSGKSTTIEFIASVLESSGVKVGIISTIRFKTGDRNTLNDKKMTMVGRFQLQKILREMVKTGCQYAIVETTSEGIEQFRHLGIHYDIAVFTNLYPEHIDSHGSFENYKSAKLKLFKHLESLPHKYINSRKILKTIIVNSDDEHSEDFLDFRVDKKIGYSINKKALGTEFCGSEKPVFDFRNPELSTLTDESVVVNNISYVLRGIEFIIHNSKFLIRLLGSHNVYNALVGICVARSQNIGIEYIQKGLESVKEVPGRIEVLDEGQQFTVIVDYAFEPYAMQKLYDVVSGLPHRKIIHVLGTTGGGRDKDRGEKLGVMAGKFADMVIVTNEDPYDDDPEMLMDRVVRGAMRSNKKLEKDLLKILNRRSAINHALSLARKNDVVLITGKGCEQGMVVKNNRIIPWDDRKEVREELRKFNF